MTCGFSGDLPANTGDAETSVRSLGQEAPLE